jgi:ribosomal-protein-alanine N-acetyltransferase
MAASPIRTMTPTDLDEAAALAGLTLPAAWTRHTLLGCLRSGCISRVLRPAGRLGAFGILSPAAAEMRLLLLCTDPALQGTGLGRRLLADLVGAARAAGAERLLLTVQASNHPAVRLYRGAGFRCVGPAETGRTADGDLLSFRLDLFPGGDAAHFTDPGGE